MSRAAAWIAFAIAFLLVFFDLIDRQILAALFPYIKAEWSLADTQLGSLVTIVNVSIAALVVPSGILVDRCSRKKVLGLMGPCGALCHRPVRLCGPKCGGWASPPASPARKGCFPRPRQGHAVEGLFSSSL